MAQFEENYAQIDEDRPLLTLVQLRRRKRELENEVAQLKQQLLVMNIKSKDLYTKMNKYIYRTEFGATPPTNVPETILPMLPARFDL